MHQQIADNLIIGLSIWNTLLACAWLLFETDFMRIRLPCGASVKTTTPKLLTVRELLDGLGDCPALPMPKSWVTFTPCTANFENETTDNVVVIYGKE